MKHQMPDYGSYGPIALAQVVAMRLCDDEVNGRRRAELEAAFEEMSARVKRLLDKPERVKT